MRILFITDTYYPKPRINAVQVHNVACSFVANGHAVDVLTLENGREDDLTEKDGVEIFRVAPDLRQRLITLSGYEGKTAKGRLSGLVGGILSKAEKLVHQNRFPLASVKLARRLCDAGLRLQRERDYDLVVAVYWPAECVHAALLMKEKTGAPKYVLFEDDAFPPVALRRLPARSARRACRNWANEVYGGFDAVLALPGNEEWFSRSDVQARMNKVKIVGAPMLVVANAQEPPGEWKSPLDVSTENWVYSGALDDSNYDPERMIESFLDLPQDRERRLYIISGTRPAYCERMQKETKGRICLMDYVPHDELLLILSFADVLVSMKKSERMSGKIFEYMGLKKPVVHFSGSTEDPDVKYLERYPLSVIVKTYEQGSAESGKWIIERLNSLPSKSGCNLSALEEFTPEYTRDVLLAVAEW